MLLLGVQDERAGGQKGAYSQQGRSKSPPGRPGIHFEPQVE
jgi:hypothetical protein